MAVEITHPDKVLFPRDGYTKADMIAHYERVAKLMIPHLRHHPLAMLRFNKGIDGERFFHKQAPAYFPRFIGRVEVPKAKGTTTYPVVDNRSALLYIANHNTIEFHPLLVRTDDLTHPDRMVFDLDPSDENFDAVRESARWVHEILEGVGLASFLMTSGSRGLHVWVPLDRSSSSEEVLSFAAEVAGLLERRHPDVVTTQFSKKERGTRVYLDVARNAPAQHTVAPYSLRAKDRAPVATPLAWEELDSSGLGPRSYTMADLPDRLERAGDPWEGMARRARSLGKAHERLRRLAVA